MTDEDGMRLGELEGIVGEEDGYTAESDAAILLQGLDIPDELHERTMAELQGGQKVRVLLAQALFGHPQALLLDEPTNHLDLDSIHWLREFLVALRRHADRHLARPPLPERGLHAHRRHRLRDDHHLHRRLRRHGAGEDADPLAHRGRATRSARRRSRSSTTSSRASAPARARARCTSRRKEVERLQTTELARSNIQRPYIKFAMKRPSGRLALECRGRRQGATATLTVVSSFSAIVNRGEKIVLVGRNGARQDDAAEGAAGRRAGHAAVAGRHRRRHGALGARGVDRLLPAGPHRRDREGADRRRVAAPVRSRTRRGRTSTACSARCSSAARKA